MALTLAEQQKLDSVSLVKFFEDNKNTWKKMAKRAHGFVKESFPANASIRPDDVAKALIPVLEVCEPFLNYLRKNRLRQKYWIRYFADYILDKGFTEEWW